MEDPKMMKDALMNRKKGLQLIIEIDPAGVVSGQSSDAEGEIAPGVEVETPEMEAKEPMSEDGSEAMPELDDASKADLMSGRKPKSLGERAMMAQLAKKK